MSDGDSNSHVPSTGPDRLAQLRAHIASALDLGASS